MNQAHLSVKEEYKSLDEHLDKISTEQDIIERQLDSFMQELESAGKNTMSDIGNTEPTLISQCKNLNERLVKIDENVENMINGLNQDTYGSEKLDPDNLTINTNIILNNYFEALRSLEMETLTLRNKLDHVCEKNNLI
jgi:tetrahydromethanopterin S-methyltransferase subunit G